METNRTIFESHGYLYKGAAETLEIQISQSGDGARYQSTVRTIFFTRNRSYSWPLARNTILKKRRQTIYNDVRQKTLLGQIRS